MTRGDTSKLGLPFLGFWACGISTGAGSGGRGVGWRPAVRLCTTTPNTHACIGTASLLGQLLKSGAVLQVHNKLLHTTPVVGVERVYLMTTSRHGFYQQLGFQDADPQQLIVLRR